MKEALAVNAILRQRKKQPARFLSKKALTTNKRKITPHIYATNPNYQTSS
jgi:hypothetical protein